MSTQDRLAVCSWSLQPTGCDDLIAKVKQTGLSRVQLHLDPVAEKNPGWEDGVAKLKAAGITAVSGMVGCVGEDYSTIDAIHRTGGVVPDATWPATKLRMQAAAPVAAALGLKLVTFHAGFIPDADGDPVFRKVLERIGTAARIFDDHGSAIALETGQEAAATLMKFLHALPATTVGINFDPANMLLYGSGEPIPALKLLLPHVKQVHLKDAVPSGKPGEWGSEVPAGTGNVDWNAFFATLKQGGYTGNLVIEREAGERRVADVKTAAGVATKLA
jgi:sugar phosphate isomerase/epimerase